MTNLDDRKYGRKTVMSIICTRRLMSVAALMLAFNVSFIWAGSPTVSNVRASQRAQTQLVDVFYDLSATNSGPFSVSMAVSTNNGSTYNLPASSFTGNGIGSSVTLGTRKQVVWNAGVDWPGQYSSAVRFQVTATESGVAGDYLVVDLSAGPSASSYPVSYLTAVPSGGWTDEYKTTKMVFRRIPAGTFTMGSPVGELGRQSDETQHQVTLTQPFYIGVFEVTQKQWERVMGTWPSYFNNASYRDSRPVERVSYYQIRENPANSDDPAVSWPTNSTVNADSFMGRLRARTGKAFDLPTESQWEYAGRAGTTTALNSGKNLTAIESCPNMSEVGRYWYNGGSGYTQNGDTSVATAKVGSYLPNAWGLYDIHGNVWEWCLDWFPGYEGSYRVFRGGGWSGYAYYCRVAIRSYAYPDYASYYLGFRVALPPGQ
jgi:formylglycine-generating enzyme required for sulfatase activity